MCDIDIDKRALVTAQQHNVAHHSMWDINTKKPVLGTAQQHNIAHYFACDIDIDKRALDTAQQHNVAHHPTWHIDTKKPVLGTAQQHNIAQHSVTNYSLMWQSGEIQKINWFLGEYECLWCADILCVCIEWNVWARS